MQATAYQEGSCTILRALSVTLILRYWIAFYLLSPNEGEFFDSYGNEPTYFTGPIANFALRYNRMNYNPMTLQSNKTAVCGQYCVYYLYSRCREDKLIKNTPSHQQVTEFDHQMSKILNSKLPDYENVHLYYELLKRKMNLQDYNLPGITSENHAFEDEHTVQKDESVKLKEEIKPKVDENYMSIILESVPKTYKNQAPLLLNILKDKPNTLNWNEHGEVSFKDKKYQHSNLADLFNMIFTNRKPSPIIAKEEFLQALQELNIPRHYIKNKYLKIPFVLSKKCKQCL
ncbi:uncharacterized protein TNCV_1217031 [Trichonephila clavipes]|nr:uncharacterized protein TNCV_1217031 [Trichonephila clavipes]